MKNVPVLPPRKIRKNIYLPHGLYAKVMARAREMDFDFTTTVVVALNDWLKRDPPIRVDPTPVGLTRKVSRPLGTDEPIYTTVDSGITVAVGWSRVKAFGEYMEAHPTAGQAKVQRALSLSDLETHACWEAWATEWYADELQRRQLQKKAR